jgi:hypothetical protein
MRVKRTVTPLGAYMARRGLFARIAKKLRVDPSYVSRVANGQRHNENVILALELELAKTETKGRKTRRSPGERSAPVKSRTLR